MADNIIIKVVMETAGATKSVKNYTKETKKAKKSTGGLKKALSKFGPITAAAFSVIAIKKFFSTMRESVTLFDVQAKAEAKLLTSLKGKEDVQDRLIRQAQALQTETLFGDEETINAQALLASLGLNGDEIERLIPLVQDLSTKSGMDLSSTADLIAKSVGSSTNALSRYGIEITGAVGSSERLESAVNNLNKQVGGQSVAAANAGAGAFTQYGNVVGDLKEIFGGFLVKALTPTIKGLTSFVSAITGAIDPQKTLAEKIKDTEKAITQEQVALNSLVIQITNTNIGEKERLGLIKELNFQFPNFLKGLSLENITNAELASTLKKVNTQYAIQKALKIEEVKVEDAVIKQSKAINKVSNNRVKLDNTLAEIATKRGISNQLLNKTLKEQAKIVKDNLAQDAIKIKLDSKTTQSNEEAKLIDKITNLQYGLISAKKANKKATDNSTDATKNQIKVRKDLINTSPEFAKFIKDEEQKQKELEIQAEKAKIEAEKLLGSLGKPKGGDKENAITFITGSMADLRNEVSLLEAQLSDNVDVKDKSVVIELIKQLDIAKAKLLEAGANFKKFENEARGVIEFDKIEPQEIEANLSGNLELPESDLGTDIIQEEINNTRDTFNEMYNLLKEKSPELAERLKIDFEQMATDFSNAKIGAEEFSEGVGGIVDEGETGGFLGDLTEGMGALGDSFGLLSQQFEEGSTAQRVALTAQVVAQKIAAAANLALMVSSFGKGLGTEIAKPFPANLPGIASKVAQIAGIIGLIKTLTASTKNISQQGFKEGRYTGDGNENEVAGVVHKREYVMNAKTTKENRDLLDGLHTGDKTKLKKGVGKIIEMNPAFAELMTPISLPNYKEIKPQVISLDSDKFERKMERFIVKQDEREQINSRENRATRRAIQRLGKVGGKLNS